MSQRIRMLAGLNVTRQLKPLGRGSSNRSKLMMIFILNPYHLKILNIILGQYSNIQYTVTLELELFDC